MLRILGISYYTDKRRVTDEMPFHSECIRDRMTIKDEAVNHYHPNNQHYMNKNIKFSVISYRLMAIAIMVLFTVSSSGQLVNLAPDAPSQKSTTTGKSVTTGKRGKTRDSQPFRKNPSIRQSTPTPVPTNTTRRSGRGQTSLGNQVNSVKETHTQQWAIDNILKNMVLVEGGTFSMGVEKGSSKDATDDNYPAHNITLSPYYICKYEVTEEEWLLIMGTEPSDKSNGKVVSQSCPVDNVSWEDCQEFVKKLSELTNKPFRLPTEAEWEFAARGGKNTDLRFSGSNDLDPCGWSKGNSTNVKHPVGEKSPNQLGLYDMTGNVREWCMDYYEQNYYGKSPTLNPQGPSEGRSHIMRGGSFNNTNEECTVTYRSYTLPSNKNKFTGLRLAYSAE